MVLFFGFKSGASGSHPGHQASRLSRRLGRSEEEEEDEETRRLGGSEGESEIQNQPAVIYIEWTRRLPYRSAPVGLCHSLFFFSTRCSLESSSAAFGAVRWQRAARGGASGWHSVTVSEAETQSQSLMRQRARPSSEAGAAACHG